MLVAEVRIMTNMRILTAASVLKVEFVQFAIIIATSRHVEQGEPAVSYHGDC
jgi:hypothetical protein